MRMKIHRHQLKYLSMCFDAPREGGTAMLVCCKSNGSDWTATIMNRNCKATRDAKSSGVLE